MVRLPERDSAMKTLEKRSGDGILRVAAWIYVLRRATPWVVILGIVGFAAVLLLIQITIAVLRNLGA